MVTSTNLARLNFTLDIRIIWLMFAKENYSGETIVQDLQGFAIGRISECKVLGRRKTVVEC